MLKDKKVRYLLTFLSDWFKISILKELVTGLLGKHVFSIIICLFESSREISFAKVFCPKKLYIPLFINFYLYIL